MGKVVAILIVLLMFCAREIILTQHEIRNLNNKLSEERTSKEALQKKHELELLECVKKIQK